MFMATWDKVPFFGANSGNCSSPNIKNTFQAILVTDGTMSFAMFYYNEIMWTTGTASRGDCQGLGGVPAKAGFDTGDGTNFYSLPGSCTSDVVGVPDSSNVNQEGKWIFRVDQANIVPPVTVTTTSAPSTTSPSSSDHTYGANVTHPPAFESDIVARTRFATQISEHGITRNVLQDSFGIHCPVTCYPVGPGVMRHPLAPEVATCGITSMPGHKTCIDPMLRVSRPRPVISNRPGTAPVRTSIIPKGLDKGTCGLSSVHTILDQRRETGG